MAGSSAPPPGPSRAPKLVAAALVLVVMLVSFWLLANRRPRPTPNTRGESEVAKLFSEAKNLVRKGQWAEAKVMLEQIREEDDEYEPKQIENYFKVVAEELPNQERFATATDAIGKGELGRAAAALAKVKTRTQERALTEAKEALALKIEARRGEARTLLAAGRWEPLLALSEDLLVALPGDREGADWKQQAEQGIARGKRGPTKAVTTETPWVEAQQRFKSGDVTGAISLADSCAKKYPQCRKMKSGLEEFELKSRRVEALSDSELVEVFQLDQTLAGGASTELSKPVRIRLATRFFQKASQAKTTGNWAKALEYARQALAADPSHPGAPGIISEAKGISGDLFLRAYQLRETDPPEAVKLFKEVLAMTPADDTNHVKARGFIERLEAH